MLEQGVIEEYAELNGDVVKMHQELMKDAAAAAGHRGSAEERQSVEEYVEAERDAAAEGVLIETGATVTRRSDLGQQADLQEEVAELKAELAAAQHRNGNDHLKALTRGGSGLSAVSM